MAFAIVSVKLTSGDTPICGVTLEPYIVVRKSDGAGACTADDVPEEGVSDGAYQLRSRWYRSTITRGNAVCNVHPEKEAAVQCMVCLRSRVPQHLSYHCTAECLKNHWHLHKEHHLQSPSNGQENGISDTPSIKPTSIYSNGETWIEVCRARKYTPVADDVGFTLKYECTVVEAARPYADISRGQPIITNRVRPAPNPPNRLLVPLHLRHTSQTVEGGKFSLLSYNLLADLYAKADGFGSFSQCAPWALSWQYRKQLLLKELLAYRADILCLQEVQSNHFLEFLSPELQRHGYTPIYKKKTTEVYTGNTYAIDGCATFFRKDRFTLVKKYEVEFNKAAFSQAEQISNPQHKKAALNRLLKDNVALIAVLEALDPPSPDFANRGRQLICVANTHIHANPELNDVKLWQVHTLLKGLEKIAASADIPMLLAGDFNSVPGSAAHNLLVHGTAEPPTSDDPLGILREQSLKHELPLVSAYSNIQDSGNTDPKMVRQKQRVDQEHREPLFTYMSRDVKTTLDYILYTKDYIVPVAILELPSESEVLEGPDACLPNAKWASDHVALMAEFQYIRTS